MRFRGDIQGLRAIAVLAVVVYHASVPFLPGGYVGVDVFFVISGFLITSQLWQQLRANGRIGFGDFYARRARRILPASLTVIALTVLGAALLVPPLGTRDTFGDAIATLLYVPNYIFAQRGVDYLASDTPSLFQHFWSLGIEEQFYLFWPLLLLGLLFAARRRPRLFLGLVALVVAGSFGYGLWLTGQSQPWAFFALPARAWELGAGGLLAIAMMQRQDDVSRVPVAVRGVAGWAGIALVLATCVLYTDATVFPGTAAVLPVAGALLLIWGGKDAPSWSANRVIAVRPMQFIGRISYSMYLVHWPLVMIPTAMTQPAGLELWQSVGLSALSLPAAYLLYRFVEEPFRAKGRAPIRVGRAFAGVAAATVVLVGFAFGAGKYVETKPLQTDVVADSFDPAKPVEAAEVVPSNIQPSLDKSREDRAEVPDPDDDSTCIRGQESVNSKPCVFGPEGAPEVVLFGDSHAAQWFPALEKVAERGDIRLIVHVKNSCQAVPVAATDEEACVTWRDQVIERMNDSPPDIVLMGNFVIGALAEEDVKDRPAVWALGMSDVMSRLPEDSRKITMADTPFMKVAPAVCLSGNVDSARQCDVPREKALFENVRAVEAALTDEIDLVDHLCDAEHCPPVLGDTLLYRDDDHLSASASAALADELWAKLEPYVAKARAASSH